MAPIRNIWPRQEQFIDSMKDDWIELAKHILIDIQLRDRDNL